MIANIANRDQVFTYISQVIGNHLTSTGLSLARHRSTYSSSKGIGTYIVDKARQDAPIVSPNSYYLMHHTKLYSCAFIKERVGGLECFRACLGSNTRSVFVR
jgi:hypothetical protein